ncbi:SDR family oxidoreductase [Acuticoccus mangrovi]|uniref:SDR family oxidoreductase n=1 Tax=Acuticoccus mangrovi TaxID=2796142 RepID=A0A934IN23_9HYPH|nr:SDR family oxidoreductase [Acuticoccus mangrovi]MBJ3775625.1 SDR family oxidoreductase [Acuticoccus mangrovi]
MTPLEGRTALVTGASSGIGAATATALAEAGAAVLATGRDAARLAEVAAAATVRTLAGDLTDPTFVAALAEAAGPVDILVNNAGALKHAPFLDSDPADWAAVFEINVLSLMRLTRAVGRGMRERGRGHIVNVSSLLARRAGPTNAVYAATKHAVAGFTAGLRAELAPHGVRVSEIAPGLVRTNVMRAIDDPAIKASYAARTYDWLQPADVAAAILHAVTAPDHVSLDLIEVRPRDQF